MLKTKSDCNFLSFVLRMLWMHHFSLSQCKRRVKCKWWGRLSSTCRVLTSTEFNHGMTSTAGHCQLITLSYNNHHTQQRSLPFPLRRSWKWQTWLIAKALVFKTYNQTALISHATHGVYLRCILHSWKRQYEVHLMRQNYHSPGKHKDQTLYTHTNFGFRILSDKKDIPAMEPSTVQREKMIHNTKQSTNICNFWNARQFQVIVQFRLVKSLTILYDVYTVRLNWLAWCVKTWDRSRTYAN